MTQEMFGCTCGRAFRSKSARSRHMNRCPVVLEYRERVEARMARRQRHSGRGLGMMLCCDSHNGGDRIGGCCDPDDCGPCCENCPTCPTLIRTRRRYEWERMSGVQRKGEAEA